MRYATDKIAKRFREAAIRVVQNYIKVNGSDFDRILETEKRFEFVIGNALITGQIDLLKKMDSSGNLHSMEIIGFKADRSGDGKYTGYEGADGLYSPDYQKQRRYYALACLNSLNLRTEKAFVHRLDSGAMEEIDISERRLEEITKEIGLRLNR